MRKMQERGTLSVRGRDTCSRIAYGDHRIAGPSVGAMRHVGRLRSVVFGAVILTGCGSSSSGSGGATSSGTNATGTTGASTTAATSGATTGAGGSTSTATTTATGGCTATAMLGQTCDGTATCCTSPSICAVPWGAQSKDCLSVTGGPCMTPSDCQVDHYNSADAASSESCVGNICCVPKDGDCNDAGQCCPGLTCNGGTGTCRG